MSPQRAAHSEALDHISESDTVQRGNVDHAAPFHSRKYRRLHAPATN
jgi:hypothetical protein